MYIFPSTILNWRK